MLNQFDLSQLACRASNLAERLFILKQLAESAADRSCAIALSTADVRQINQDLERLFPKVKVGTVAEQGPFPHLKRQAMKRALHHYRWYELNLEQFAIAQQQIFLTVHTPWIQTYQQAIALMEQTPYLSSVSQGHVTPLLDFPIQGCVPFLKHIETELTAVLAKTGAINIDPLAQQRIVALVQQIYWQRVQPMVNQAMQADESLSFWNQTSSDEVDRPRSLTEIYHAFYLHFPVLARWLAQGCVDLIQGTQLAFARLLQDCSALSDQFCSGVAIQQVSEGQANQFQDGTEGQLVWRFDLGLANGESLQIRYYPYSLEAERGLQQLFADVNGDQNELTTDRHPEILTKPGYGYMTEPEQSTQVIALESLRKVGGNLAIQQLWGSRRGIWGRMKIGIDPCDLLADSTINASETEPQMPEANQVKQTISQGFLAVEDWLCQSVDPTSPSLSRYFGSATARFCHRPPSTYANLLQTVQEASYLSQPLAVDAVFRTLIDQPCPWDSLGEIAQLEVKMLWQHKVLWLTVPMSHRYLLYEGDHALFTKLPLSPLDYLTRRIQQMASPHRNFKGEQSTPSVESPEIGNITPSDQGHKNINPSSGQKVGKVSNIPPKLNSRRSAPKLNPAIVQV